MAIITPETTKKIEDKTRADVQRSAPSSDPYLKVSWIGSLIAGFSRRMFDLYKDLSRTEQRVMLDTKDELNGRRIGRLFVGSPLPASTATGTVVATGLIGSIIPAGTQLKAAGNTFKAISSASIESHTVQIDNISSTGNTAHVITRHPHHLTNFTTVTINNAAQAEFNLTNVDITVTGENSFEYDTDSFFPAQSTGNNIYATSTLSLVSIESEDDGENKNLPINSKFTLQSSTIGVDDSLYANFKGVSGGSDEESFLSYRDRYLSKIRNPVSHFNSADIDAQAKKVPGVTRVFVYPSNTDKGTGKIPLGQVEIFIVMDNNSSPIPDGNILQSVKDQLIIPANTANQDVFVLAPSPVSVDFYFSSITPDTLEIKQAVKNSLEDLFKTKTSVGQSIDEDDYRCAINSSVAANGERVDSFSLFSPSGNINIEYGQLPILGNVSI